MEELELMEIEEEPDEDFLSLEEEEELDALDAMVETAAMEEEFVSLTEE